MKLFQDTNFFNQQEQILGRAASRVLIPLLSNINSQTTHSFLKKHLTGKPDSVGLHLASGTGTETLFIAEVLGDNGQVIGIENDEVMIEKAKQHEKIKSGCGVQFYQAKHYDGKKKNNFDFVYTRLYPSWSPLNAELIQNLGECLKERGKLLLEIQTLSSFKRYPYNHAFARSAELLGLLEAKYVDFPADGMTELSELFHSEGFWVVEHERVQPFFIESQYNHIISLSLEVFSEQIIAFGLSSQLEINALLNELKYCETQQSTLISFNGLIQILVYKK